eukprot:COSAG05_NODE_1312_length_5217_cov_2.233685_5_plen_382_part_00
MLAAEVRHDVAMPALLSPAELKQFVTEGFVIRRPSDNDSHPLLDPALLRRCADKFWASAESESPMRRGQPRSFAGPISPSAERGAAVHGMAVNFSKGFIFKERACGGDPLLLDTVPKALWPIAEQLFGPGHLLPPDGSNAHALLGPTIAGHSLDKLAEMAHSSDVGHKELFARYLNSIASGHIGDIDYGLHSTARDDLGALSVAGSRTRGIYATLPRGSAEDGSGLVHGRLHQNTSGLLDDKPPEGHVDVFPFQLGVEAYLEDVQPRGGGLLVWPGTHTRVFHHFTRQFSFTPDGKFRQLSKALSQEIPPVDCWGPKGTSILFHHRLLHAAQPNFQDTLRLAVLYDFVSTQSNDGPPPADMWRDWGVPVQRAATAISLSRL